MIAVIDYGAGNLQSVEKALRHIGCACEITADPECLLSADAAILPGVGAFGDAMENLRSRGLEKPILQFSASGKPFLGICLGLQILFENSEESPEIPGLGILKGKIVRLPAESGLKNSPYWLEFSALGEVRRTLSGIDGEPYVYFVHSYYLQAEENIITSTTKYGAEIHASVQKGNVFACQFHPEKRVGR